MHFKGHGGFLQVVCTFLFLVEFDSNNSWTVPVTMNHPQPCNEYFCIPKRKWPVWMCCETCNLHTNLSPLFLCLVSVAQQVTDTVCSDDLTREAEEEQLTAARLIYICWLILCISVSVCMLSDMCRKRRLFDYHAEKDAWVDYDLIPSEVSMDWWHFRQ